MHGHSILACCDENLLGKKIESNEFSVEIRESFYRGKKVGAKEFGEMIREAGSANLFGEKCIEAAIEEGFINRTSIIMIGNVPHAQVYKV